MALTFADARRAVAADWPDYRLARYGFETETDWILLTLPETAGGRIPLVDKQTGAVEWINENDDRYTQESPVGAWPETRV